MVVHAASPDWDGLQSLLREVEGWLDAEADHRMNATDHDGEPYCLGCEVGEQTSLLRVVVAEYVNREVE